jgi:3-isopropylmalate/(R)-2-methylmalate dehydratase small subunit
MGKLTRVVGPAVPILAANIDTDVITPMIRLTTRLKRPLADYAFEALRYLDGNADSSEPDPSFPLNQERFHGAKIMLCGENFGCGSSRESAPAAIAGLGIRCLIGPSFGDIFFNNCFQQGILPVVLPSATVLALARQAESGGHFDIDLNDQTIIDPRGAIHAFEVTGLRKRSLMEGLDDIGLTLQRGDEIRRWQERDSAARPWIYETRLSGE